MKTDANSWGVFRKSTAVGVVFFLVVVSWAPVAEAKAKPDWSRAQNVKPGTKTTVVLYTDRAPQGKTKVKGHFHSATPESIMVTLNPGQTRTLGKSAVSQILVDRPPYEGLITAGASTGIFLGLAPGWDLNGRGWALFAGLFVGLPTAIAFLVSPKMKTVYNVPRKLRDDPAPTGSPSPDKENSGAPGSGAKDPSNAPAGSTSGDLSLDGNPDPELPRLQARRAVMRHDLPLVLPSLPARGAQTGSDL